MNEQAFGALEYGRVRDLVEREAQTPMGANRARAIAPMNDANEIRKSLRAVTECGILRERGAVWSFDELENPTEALERLRVRGIVLDSFSLLLLARVVRLAGEARAVISGEHERAQALWDLVQTLPSDVARIGDDVTRKILPSGELDDSASPELARIRGETARLRSSITRSLETLMRSQTDAVQDQIVTLRNDRFVIPIRTDHRGRVGGVAHGLSSSGATVFIEPLETIEANNDLQLLREREAAEVAQVLARLTDDLRRAYPTIKLAGEIIAELDFIRAKQRFGARLDSIEPDIADDTQEFELTDARHALLDEQLRGAGKSAVPCSFQLSNANPVMVISGANAGGKTVVLKTAGLTALMALSGLHVPARRARVPVYQAVLADIGDAQSLAANLSTFTAHVSNISRMMSVCEHPALVLLDEVGTGTDPEEGSALGVAVVDYFRKNCRAHIIATTHYRGLKTYAATDKTVINASVEFDERTLQPTYRLLLGFAGSSSGLEIARRFGFPREVIDAARERVDKQTLEASDYLQRIRREAREAEDLRRALEEERRAVAEKYEAVERDVDKERRAREQDLARKLDEALQTLNVRSEQATQDLIAKIQDRAARQKLEREAANTRSSLQREAQKLARAAVASSIHKQSDGRQTKANKTGDAKSKTASQVKPLGSLVEPRELKIGDRVRVLSLGTEGVIERVKADEIEVRVGVLRFREQADNLELVAPVAAEPTTKRAAKPQRGAELRLSNTDDADAELKLIGSTVDEATDAVDKFLDESYMQGITPVRIVHGIGTGALRRAITAQLRHHPHVERFNLAPREQGGEGATIVQLKS